MKYSILICLIYLMNPSFANAEELFCHITDLHGYEFNGTVDISDSHKVDGFYMTANGPVRGSEAIIISPDSPVAKQMRQLSIVTFMKVQVQVQDPSSNQDLFVTITDMSTHDLPFSMFLASTKEPVNFDDGKVIVHCHVADLKN